jgi:hypothetical protein
MTAGEPVSGLASALNAYLDARRNDTGEARTVPLLLRSSSSCALNLSALSVQWLPRTFQNSPRA